MNILIKKDTKIYLAAILVVSTLLGAIGQVAFKAGISDTNAYELVALVCLGVIMYVLSTVIYFYALSRTSLGWAYSFGGLGYLFAVVLAAVFLGEVISPLRWAGVLIIVVGVALIGLS